MSAIDHYDTIAAISTPPGVGGIAVIRLSGKEAYNLALRGILLNHLDLRYAHFTKVLDAETQEIIDDVVVTYFKAPASYTGDDTIEISCHGGYAAAPAILELYYKLGARPALPGEFTRRAFVNGKMDLLQAEAVADLIHAVSESGKKLATRTLSGKLSQKVKKLRAELTDIASILELELDFSEQEITTFDKKKLLIKINEARNNISTLSESYSGGKILREGALVPIVGRPNAGKSSLLNALLEEERAIISHIPGTTRDTIEESFVHNGVVFRLVDTAGLRDTDNPIEKIGTDKAKQTLTDADLVLLIVDLENISDLTFEKEFLKTYSHLPIIVVYNKVDLFPDIPFIDTDYYLNVSALNHTGLDTLTDLMVDLLKKHYRVGGDTIAITKHRHKNALNNASEALVRTKEALASGLSNEFLALDIREAISALDEITGHTTSEDVLNNIFDHFCVGK
ncbi:MAG: tRNA uridine-5-carboxymethylaminomethyl(34) synthesis GTPase MnmE [Candidatus Marinimicrobia bacterium]|nr:tRNA uridine-5-carboxymethylaminomethyl(34) synthesis GTPase MnmE [Candidatus Neomarinimicrobiota bacterium]